MNVKLYEMSYQIMKQIRHFVNFEKSPEIFQNKYSKKLRHQRCANFFRNKIGWYNRISKRNFITKSTDTFL